MEKIVIGLLVFALVVAIALLLGMWRALKKAQKSERMKNAFLLHVNHQIREPLKVVKKLSDTVAKEDLYLSKNEKRSISEQLVYNAGLVATLMDEVMLFSDVEQTGHQLKMESFSPNALCCRCLEANLHSIFHREAVKMTFCRELSDEFFVKSDRHLVELIIWRCPWAGRHRRRGLRRGRHQARDCPQTRSSPAVPVPGSGVL